MSKVRWVEIARSNANLRFSILSESMKDIGIDNEVNFIQVEPSDFVEELSKAKDSYDFIRVGSPFGTEVIKQFQGVKSNVIRLGAADCIWKKEGYWDFLSSTYIGLQRIIHEIGVGIDLDSSILVVGAGAGARAAIGAFVKFGFKNVKITNKFPEQARALIKELNMTYFGVKFEFVPEEKLVMLPGTNGVLINTTPLTASNDILNELYYFNFLKSPGLVIDFTTIPLDTPLLKEAEDIGIKTVRGFEVSSWGDVAWLEMCFNVNLDREKYAQNLKSKITLEQNSHKP